MNPHKICKSRDTWSSSTQSWPTLWKLHESGELETGIAEIDCDHRNLVTLIGQLNAAIIWRMGIDKVSDAMQALIDDATKRFTREVTLLALSGYPEVDQHAKHHSETMTRLRKIMYGLGRDTPEHLWIEAGLNVKRLLIDHLLTEDMKYRDYFKNPHSSKELTMTAE
ncbi:MAG: hemerythrin domain-containing protein [Gallionella sp.]